MDDTFTYTLVRSRRRTVGITIRDGAVTVRAPLRAPQRDIERFVQAKHKWIAGHLARQQAVRSTSFSETLQLAEGARLPMFGETLTLSIIEGRGKNASVRRLPDSSEARASRPTPDTDLFPAVERMYRREAQRWFAHYVAQWGHAMGLSDRINSVRVSDYRSQWGSCSSKGVLRFSWRLALAPVWVSEYVIVHELAHLQHMNHGRNFWALVARHYPDHLEARAWLRTHGAKLR